MLLVRSFVDNVRFVRVLKRGDTIVTEMTLIANKSTLGYIAGYSITCICESSSMCVCVYGAFYLTNAQSRPQARIDRDKIY